MAILFGNPKCSLCGEELNRPALHTSGVAFPSGHKLYTFCDTPMHIDCLQDWDNRKEFFSAYFQQRVSQYEREGWYFLEKGDGWFLGKALPYEGQADRGLVDIYIEDWPISFHSEVSKWNDFINGSWRDSATNLHSYALARAETVIKQIRELIPDHDSLQQLIKQKEIDSRSPRISEKEAKEGFTMLKLEKFTNATFSFYYKNGIVHHGKMPLQLLKAIRSAKVSCLTTVKVREANDEIYTDQWPLEDDIALEFGDEERQVHLISHYEDGKPVYNFVTKRLFDNHDKISTIALDKSLSDEEKKRQVDILLKAESKSPPKQTKHEFHSPLQEKAKSAAFAVRILIDSKRIKLEQQHPEVLLLPKWERFLFAGTVAGSIAVAMRLHYEAPEDLRTKLEEELRKTLEKELPHSKMAYEDCYRFVVDHLTELNTKRQPAQFFVFLGLWVYLAVADGEDVESKNLIIAMVADLYQREVPGYWKS